MIKLFFMMFVQLFLVTMSSRFSNRGQYIHQFFVSFFIGIMWCGVFKDLLTLINEPYAILYYSLGSSLGAICGIAFHKRFLPTKKEVDKW